jgi:lipopolysaccharide transport system ATP-binding protein
VSVKSLPSNLVTGELKRLMSDVAIRVENLSKLYHIGKAQQRHDTLRDALVDGLRAPFARFRRNGKTDNHEANDLLWALKDVSFEVKRGEVLGIIGRNGSGKSTLLKILSRITEPTEGRANIHGRVASLLEVGTGFHPELTGRENIYLNGAILGMKRTEIDRKFDEIVAFAEIERFLDTPVKRYSSGMYVRLAFAVAAHLEPEILIVDEVLAVGDAEFQKKCLDKMQDVAGKGRTVLFVSHNMAAVLSLCRKTNLLDYGRVVFSGTTGDIVSRYMENISRKAEIPLSERKDRGGNGSVRLVSLRINNSNGDSIIRCGDRLRIIMAYQSTQNVSGPAFLVNIYDEFNRSIFFLDSQVAGGLPSSLSAAGVITCITEPVNITPGFCGVNVAVLAGGVIADHIKQAIAFNIEVDDFYGTGKLINRQQALCLVKQQWQVEDWSDSEYLSNVGASA